MADPAVRQLIGNLQKVESAPALRTFNGFGFRLSGSLMLPGMNGVYISAYWFVALFLPIIPLGLYVVSGHYPGPYKFYGKLAFGDAVKAYGSRIWWLVASAWLEGAFMLVGLVVVITIVVGGMSLLRRH
jgi:hypothetical protein